ncbi:MAG TPA: thiamine pyrophosphate-dependent enzyme [Ferruginibacter sp.]|nr:thiamine pyrophosphate-dependent enzyme [Ferruginibacter sp.]HQV43401.1 thiamine pyrophosphate-dependent enzyme [Ferruginibacter sp.]HQW61043.1 thiamine pyrophosphate-dependent enzyme [Ferruginibacter sp.]HQY16866.1 thiamine pyrophosphate-dependent enzyme [Ferruginibacter sp.]HQY40540.1 thiamine pyrophosphate-dependent enzyme [Ferruginibacter sp.]
MINDTLLRAYTLMCTAKAMAETYEANRQICKYVHSTSRGHEAIQLATAFHLLPCDYVSPYYRDESLMLGLGFEPFTLMLQLLAKGNDIFTGGREYYNHPNYKKEDKPTIIHQSSATGMQAIPTTGIAQGLKFLAQTNNTLLKKGPGGEMPVVICSLGDASVTEGEVSEAFQFAALHQLPIIYLVQDNDWGISVTGSEARTTTAFEFIEGFKGIERVTVDGSNFEESFNVMQQTIAAVRKNRKPWLVHAKVPLLGHHTSGVRKETYRSNEDLQKHFANDPVEKLKNQLLQSGINAEELEKIEEGTKLSVQEAFEKTVASPEPDAATVSEHIFAETAIIEEKGERSPAANKKIVMVDAALFAIREIMEDHPEALLYGQDVGRRLGGVFREAATLAEQFGDNRVFNTAIQEAYIIGSTVGMSAVGLKPIVEVQFADYIYPGLNQLVTEISKSCYLSCGKFPVQTLIRVPIGAYGGGGPYHSGSVESTLLTFKGIKVVYPSNAADMKGLLKAAFYDPNPVVMLEHKGLYWSKVAGTEEAMQIEPSRDYIVPLGKANIALTAAEEKIANGESCCIITYGMGVFWARVAAKNFNQSIEVIDLRTLFPLDEELVFTRVKKHGKCLILTEEQQNNSFAEALAGRVSKACFQQLDAPVEVLGALNLPAVPMNLILENAMLPNAEKVTEKIKDLLKY